MPVGRKAGTASPQRAAGQFVLRTACRVLHIDAGRRMMNVERIGILLQKFIVGNEFNFFGQNRFCPSLINDSIYGTFIAVETFHQLLDISALFIQPVDFRGLGRLDCTGGFFEDGLVGIRFLVVEKCISDGLVAFAGFFAYFVYYLVT